MTRSLGDVTCGSLYKVQQVRTYTYLLTNLPALATSYKMLKTALLALLAFSGYATAATYSNVRLACCVAKSN